MRNMLSDPFALIAICVVAGGFLMAGIYQLRVRMSGIEAEATVTWIEEKEQPDPDGGYNRYYDIHVTYMTKDGEYIEGTLANAIQPFEEGERIRIKYIPSRKENPVFIGRM